MASTLYVSNPHHKARRRRNPAPDLAMFHQGMFGVGEKEAASPLSSPLSSSEQNALLAQLRRVQRDQSERRARRHTHRSPAYREAGTQVALSGYPGSGFDSFFLPPLTAYGGESIPGANVAKSKSERSPAQRAATRKMIAANKAKARGGKSRAKRTVAAKKWAYTKAASKGIRKDSRNLPNAKTKRTPASKLRAKQTARRISQRAKSIIRNNPLRLRNPVGNIPVLGTAVSLIGPALFGALGVEMIGQVHVVASKMGVEVPEMLQPYTYTIGGLAIAGVIQLFTFLPAPVRYSLGLATASAGGAVDMYRYRSGSGAYGALEMGDAGEWTVEVAPGNMGALEMGALELGALELGDVDMSGDEDYSGADFSVAEGQCLADEGYGAYHRRFVRPMARKIHDPAARRGVEGARWLHLMKKIGPEGMEQLAKLGKDERLNYIKAAQNAIKQGVQVAAPRPQLRIVEGIRDSNLPRTFAKADWSHAWGPGESF